MTKLAQLLSYLGRNDVRAVVFRTGNPVVLRTDQKILPVTAAPLTSSQIQRFFESTPVAALLPRFDEPEQETVLALANGKYAVTVGQTAGILEVRIGLPQERRPAPVHSIHPTRDVPKEPRLETLQARPSSSVASSFEVVSRPPRGGPEPVSPAVATASSVAATQAKLAAVVEVGPADKPGLDPKVAVDPATIDAAVVELSELLRQARAEAASDVHLFSDAPVRVRNVGELTPRGRSIPHARLAAMLQGVLSVERIEQVRARGYTDLAMDVEGGGRLRVNVCRQRTGLKACFRLVADEPPSIEALGLPAEVRKLTNHHQGLVLITGPNGHGKTTTLSALVDLFNASRSDHIITVEDPVEIIHPRKKALVTQREVGTHTRSFQSALAAALREDPDVIAIGELRDRETVEMALSAAETGHLVLATMSTPSAAKTIDRVIDLFPPDDQSQVRATLAGALKLVVSQRLLRRSDGRQMVAAFEMVTGNVPLWTLIRDNKLFQLPSLLQRGRTHGMIRLEDSLRELLSAGLITREEALVWAEDKRALDPREDVAEAATAEAGGSRFWGRRGGA